MKKFLVIIIILLVAVLAVMTRPDKQAHKEAMMKAVKEYVDEEASNQGFGDNIFTDLGKGVVNKVIEAALGTKLKVDDYYLRQENAARRPQRSCKKQGRVIDN